MALHTSNIYRLLYFYLKKLSSVFQHLFGLEKPTWDFLGWGLHSLSNHDTVRCSQHHFLLLFLKVQQTWEILTKEIRSCVQQWFEKGPSASSLLAYTQIQCGQYEWRLQAVTWLLICHLLVLCSMGSLHPSSSLYFCSSCKIHLILLQCNCCGQGSGYFQVNRRWEKDAGPLLGGLVLR